MSDSGFYTNVLITVLVTIVISLAWIVVTEVLSVRRKLSRGFDWLSFRLYPPDYYIEIKNGSPRVFVKGKFAKEFPTIDEAREYVSILMAEQDEEKP